MSVSLRVDDFDYDLPTDLIAQEPAPRRDGSRLLALDRSAGVPVGLRHLRFSDLPSLLSPGDLLVLNDTRVLPARLIGKRAAPDTGGRVEALLIERTPEAGCQVWRALLKGGCRVGEPIAFEGGLRGRVRRREQEEAEVELTVSSENLTVEAVLERFGRMPTPPYIRRDRLDTDGSAHRLNAVDRERYQTVFARVPGALAAPTAGLHFTRELLEAVVAVGADVEYLTLHVGLGTFRPVRTERVEDHRMHAERFELPARLAAAVSRARARGRRVVAVGTTVARAMEWQSSPEGDVRPGVGSCDLFIFPGYRFRAVDALLTNFHLPRSTLLMLVSAFADRSMMMRAYAAAIEARYRFYSYGDAMFIY